MFHNIPAGIGQRRQRAVQRWPLTHASGAQAGVASKAHGEVGRQGQRATGAAALHRRKTRQAGLAHLARRPAAADGALAGKAGQPLQR